MFHPSRNALPFFFLLTTSIVFAQSASAPLQTQAPVPPGRVVISGAVPSEAAKAALLTRLQELYGTGQIIDQLTISDVTTPPNWSTQIPKLLTNNLKSISKGQLSVDGNNVAVHGEVNSEAVRQAIANDFAGALGPNYVVKNGLRVTAASQTILDQALANRVVEFETGSAMLTESGKLVLNDMVDALKKANAKKVEIIGHTDNQGSQAYNLALSRSRADAVKTYLVAKGIATGLIATSGMGADQPVVPNTTDEGRKRNRRIEFRVSQ